MKKTIFIKNALILTASSLLLRFAGIIFKVWLAAKIGAEGIGLYQLIFSVYVLVASFATVGICTAVTRLISEEAALGSAKGIKRIVRRSIELTLIIALFSLAAVFFGADFIADKFLGDIRASLSLKILGFSLPFMGISSCIKGYFIAFRKVSPPATAQIIEQIIRIGLIMLIIMRVDAMNLTNACAAILFGDTVAEAASAVYIYILYCFDKKHLNNLSGRTEPPYSVTREIGRISTPITLGRYLNSGLRTIENILVPKNLARFSTSKNALAGFGMIKGMALPLLFFPSALLNSISTLLIPEMSEAMAMGNSRKLKSATEKTVNITCLMGILFGAVFLVLGKDIGLLIYKDIEVGFLISALAPIVPLMYLDSVCDGILKGLDQQNFCFRNSIFDSSLRILLIGVLLSHTGLRGFIGIMYFSNALTCLLNVARLIKVTNAQIDFLKEIVLPVLTALFSVLCFSFIFQSVPMLTVIRIGLVIIMSCITYLALLAVFGSFKLSFEDKRGINRT